MAKIKKEMTKWERAEVAANLSAIAYMNATKGQKASKAMGFTKARLIAKDGAEVLVAYSPTTLWFAFRGTEPSKLNDVLADLKVLKRKAEAGGRVHSGFQDEVDELWDDLKLELIKNDQRQKPRDVYVTGHSLGGGMATIAASRCEAKAVYTFGSPRVGNAKFVNTLDCPHYRFVNNNDIVCKVPPCLLLFKHDGECIYFNAYGNVRDLSAWQKTKDMFRGIWAGWKQGKFFDMFTDHGIGNYVDNVARVVKEKS